MKKDVVRETKRKPDRHQGKQKNREKDRNSLTVSDLHRDRETEAGIEQERDRP